MTVQFENTSNYAHAVRWYSVEGAPTIESKPWNLSPCSAKFSFVNGKLISVEVRGCVVKKDGSLSERFMEITSINMWSDTKWPDWLKRLRDFAVSEFKHNIQANGNKIVFEEVVAQA